MAEKELPGKEMISTLSPDQEAPTTDAAGRRGGWITFPFLTVGVAGLSIAASGWSSNLIVYLIEKFNFKSIHATQLSNILNGSSNFFPIAGAIVADSFFGNFLVITVSTFISLLGLILLTLTATLHSLKPPHCKAGADICEAPSPFQLAILYSAITLVAIGMGGTRFTTATMGADQFDKPKDQRTFINWYFFTIYIASVIGITAIVYIEDSIGWGLGFGLCLAINALGQVAFLSGKQYYRHIKPQGSPFTSLARVIVATVRKHKMVVSSEIKDYYYGNIAQNEPSVLIPTSSLRFLNRAAMKTEADCEQETPLDDSWSLCTVQQVEDLKTLISILPLWSTAFFVSIPLGMQSSLLVLQALRMDRHLGQHFSIPAGSFFVFLLLSTAISLSIIDGFLFPLWKRLIRHSMRPLERIGIGHVLNIIGMAASALVESRRLHVAQAHNLTHVPNSIVPMSALWLVVPLAIAGVGEAFHFPGQVALYYQEFPVSLRSTATAMISLIVAVGFYLSTALIDLIQRVTSWLPDNINEGRIDNVFWLLVVIGVINFGYYITCAMMYTYKNVEDSEQKSESVDISY